MATALLIHYDFSNYSNDLSISLVPGEFVDLDVGGNAQRAYLGDGNYARGHIFNALQYNDDARSLIENATGGSGDDTIQGNAANNNLAGNNGNDTIDGGDGNDYLKGGAGADVLDGGAGSDWASYSSSSSGITIDLTQAIGTGVGGEAQGDTLQNIEKIYGSDHNDSIYGSSTGNSFYGRGGNDSLYGNNGDDILDGGDGNDYLNGGNGADVLNGGAGSDWVSYSSSAAGVTIDLRNATGTGSGGEAEGDTLIGIEKINGSAHNDIVYGNAANESFYGNGGNDNLYGYDGVDLLDGGTGDDYLQGGLGSDTLRGGSGSDWAAYSLSTGFVSVDLQVGAGIAGNALGDVLIDIEKLYGSNFSDGLRGDGNDNVIYGRGGGDILNGRGGNDMLNGGAGNDIFEFTASAASSVDTVMDFVDDADTLRITTAAYANVTGDINDLLTNHATAVGNDVHIALDGNNTIVVQNFLATNSINDLANDILLI